MTTGPFEPERPRFILPGEPRSPGPARLALAGVLIIAAALLGALMLNGCSRVAAVGGGGTYNPGTGEIGAQGTVTFKGARRPGAAPHPAGK